MADIDNDPQEQDDNVPNESKSDKFKRIARRRTTNALKQIELLENLSNKGQYEYTERQVVQIIEALRKSVDLLEQKFFATKDQSKKGFDFTEEE